MVRLTREKNRGSDWPRLRRMKFQAKGWNSKDTSTHWQESQFEAIYLAFQPISPRVLSAPQCACIQEFNFLDWETVLKSALFQWRIREQNALKQYVRIPHSPANEALLLIHEHSILREFGQCFKFCQSFWQGKKESLIVGGSKAPFMIDTTI